MAGPALTWLPEAVPEAQLGNCLSHCRFPGRLVGNTTGSGGPGGVCLDEVKFCSHQTE